MTQKPPEPENTLDKSIIEHLAQAKEHLRQALIIAAQQDIDPHILQNITNVLNATDRSLEPDLLRKTSQLVVRYQKFQERSEQSKGDQEKEENS